jgi:hypothetical protein
VHEIRIPRLPEIVNLRAVHGAASRRQRFHAASELLAGVPPELRGSGNSRPDVTSHDIAALVRMRHSKVRVPNVYAAIFRLVTNGTIKKTGERGSFHYALN